MINPPNSFLQFCKVKDLRAWLKELNWRNRDKETREIYKGSMVPTIKQVKAEMKRRKLI